MEFGRSLLKSHDVGVPELCEEAFADLQRAESLAELAVELLNDPRDSVSFSQLTTQLPKLKALQADFLEVLSKGLKLEGTLDLNQCGATRVAQLLETLPITEKSVGLALAVLEHEDTFPKEAGWREELLLAALSHLSRGSDSLSADDAIRLLKLAQWYGAFSQPCGKYENGFQVNFAFDKESLNGLDLAGAGAVLLLRDVPAEMLQAALKSADTNLCELAIKFSKLRPNQPNLFIRLLERPDCEAELQRLFNYQHDQMSDRETFEIMWRSFKEGMHVAIFASPVVTSVVNLVMGKGLKQVAGALAATTATVVVFRGFGQFLKALKEHKMSPLHRSHLEAVMAGRQTAEKLGNYGV
jgi:hypothetical protein